jgi:alkanesulfonate monooxygenase SsuD/methylene tetrahydromethanopterin reductase-like flavin-dependent oxidoreductase (luciferase family)
MGFEEVAARVSELWAEGRYQEAAAAVPTKVVEQLALVGLPTKIREELDAWRGSLLTTLVVHVPLDPQSLQQVDELVLG